MHVLANRSVWAIKVGLFLVVLVWFCFTVYQFGEIFHGSIEVAFTDVPATLGLGLRIVASLIALTASVLYLGKNDFSFTHAIGYFRWSFLFEAAYWLSFLPSGIWGFQYSTILYSPEFFIIGTGVPCILEAIIMPSVLVTLFFKTPPKKPVRVTIKWALITLSAYLFVFWFNYTAQWWSEIFVSGTELIWQSRLYTFEFALTIVGLLILFIYTGVYTKYSSGSDAITKINLRNAGAIITAFGLYFDLLLLLWLLFPHAGDALTVWPTFSVEHNLDLWMTSLPLIGVPLMLFKKKV